MKAQPSFWSRVKLHYDLNIKHGFHPICAMKKAIRLVWKTHYWPGADFNWMEWPPSKIDTK